MDVLKLFNELKTQFGPKFRFLEDKPDETIDSTLKACWQYASGHPMSAAEAMKYPLSPLDENMIKHLVDLLERRTKDIPLAHLVGRQNFLGIEFLTDGRALIPRKETEILGKKALELSFELAKGKDTIHIMDMCCGSGNLGLAVAHLNQKVKLYASDLSEDAVSLAKDNSHYLNLNNRVQFESGDMFAPFENGKNYEMISLIICNPPYISSAKVKKMNTEIAAHEPALAFDGGMLGFKVIQMLIEKAPVFLEKNGWLIFEVGLGQGKFIIQLCERINKYGKLQTVEDDQGNIRVIMAQKA
ncbi:MAG: peptide chain release factor N(5)-glutamine methyltransferase [Chitinophagaceae bacterium]|jgi:release factor glutamine methyltransferase|nr:peptide chain release factor N(5)-glutamine methyltransferase [Chitinophagaceae bacterium]OQY93786.1 MAG: protein-(glutamine-N5) methyltransferase, release factor-specific [Sphingobacteriales bacterium UTBCD1]